MKKYLKIYLACSDDKMRLVSVKIPDNTVSVLNFFMEEEGIDTSILESD